MRDPAVFRAEADAARGFDAHADVDVAGSGQQCCADATCVTLLAQFAVVQDVSGLLYQFFVGRRLVSFLWNWAALSVCRLRFAYTAIWLAPQGKMATLGSVERDARKPRRASQLR